LASALHAITLLTASQLVLELERIKAPTQCHVLPTACPLGVSPFDFSRTSELIEQAYERTVRWIGEGGLAQNAIPPALRPHAHSARAASRRDAAGPSFIARRPPQLHASAAPSTPPA
jgi:NTE family protein